MNAAFEDCFLLYQSLKADRAKRPADEKLDFLSCIKEFADKRTPSANGLADLCLEHYHGLFVTKGIIVYCMNVLVCMTSLQTWPPTQPPRSIFCAGGESAQHIQ